MISEHLPISNIPGKTWLVTFVESPSNHSQRSKPKARTRKTCWYFGNVEVRKRIHKNLPLQEKKNKRNTRTFSGNINESTPLVEIDVRVVPLQQPRVKADISSHRTESLPGSERVRDEQAIIGNIGVPTRAIHRDVERAGVGNVIRFIGVKPPEPGNIGEVGEDGPGDILVGVLRLNIVLESVGEKLTVDAVAREGDVDPYEGLNAVLVGDGVLVVEDYVVGSGEKGRGHDLGDVGEVGARPHVVGAQRQRATLPARRFCCQHKTK